MVLKISEYDESFFDNVNNAIEYLKKNNFCCSISMYDISQEDAYKKAYQLYDVVKAYNLGKPLSEQILPTYPYGFRAIKGCLGVQAYEIGFNTYERNHDSIALFTGYKDDVLDTSNEKARIVPSLKALASLSMLGQMYLERH